MGEVGCCQLGVYIPLCEFAEFPRWEVHLKKIYKKIKQTPQESNKQKQSNKTIYTFYSNWFPITYCHFIFVLQRDVKSVHQVRFPQMDLLLVEVKKIL